MRYYYYYKKVLGLGTLKLLGPTKLRTSVPLCGVEAL